MYYSSLVQLFISSLGCMMANYFAKELPTNELMN